MRPAIGFILFSKVFEAVYPPSIVDRICARARALVPQCEAKEFLSLDDGTLAEIEYLFTGWGAPKFDADLLNRLPNLRGIFHAGGTVRPIVSAAFWERGLFITSSSEANSVPVGQYCLAQIILSLKGAPSMQRALRSEQKLPSVHDFKYPGNHRTTVGLISLGATARQLIRLCQQGLSYNLIGFDPLLDEWEFSRIGVKAVSLDEIFEQSHAVSLHTPLLPETVGMIREEHFLCMKPWSTFLNSARGAIVDTVGMVRAARKRPDIQFVLDVAEPEPLPVDHALYDLPNVFITPHIAGALGAEAETLGAAMLDEFERHLDGDPLLYAWCEETLSRKA